MPVRSSEVIAQIRAAYESPDVPVRVLHVMFSLTPGEIQELARRYRWTKRADAVRDLTPRQRAEAARQAEADRERALYNGSTADVRLLRSRGFIVTREGDGIRVGNRVCTFDELHAKAGRERRLLQGQTTAAGGGATSTPFP